MILTELGAVAPAALPLEPFRAHLRLPEVAGSEATPGAGAEAEGLEAALRAALAAIEARTGKALLARDFRLTLSHWQGGAVQVLPLAPVGAVVSLAVLDRDGGASVVDPVRYGLEADAHRPRLVARGALLPSIPRGGRVEIVFTAGFGAEWGDLPPDLARAVLMLAAHYWEERHLGAGHGTGGLVPFGVATLIERWRIVRVLGGRAGREGGA